MNKLGACNPSGSPYRVVTVMAIAFLVLAPLLAHAYTSYVSFAVVKGNSMLPLLREGDLVVLVRPGPEDIKVGDIIVYKALRAGSTYIIHRVIAVEKVGSAYYYRTAGDNNRIVYTVPERDFKPGPAYIRIVGSEDGWIVVERYVEDRQYYDAPYGVSYSRVLGKVISIGGKPLKVPYLGYVSLLIRG